MTLNIKSLRAKQVAATEGEWNKVLTQAMVQEMIAAMPKPLPVITLNPYVRMPADNNMTLADEKEAGTLPGNILLSKAVPLLCGYKFDRSLFELEYILRTPHE